MDEFMSVTAIKTKKKIEVFDNKREKVHIPRQKVNRQMRIRKSEKEYT